jgi:hypothetical protein
MSELPRDRFVELLHTAGRRTMPDGGRTARARQTVYEEWRAHLRRRRNLQWRTLAAASVALAVVGGWLLRTSDVPTVSVASTSRVSGKVLVGREPLTVGRDLLAGDIVETQADGRAAIHWLRNAQLRLDTGSLVELKSERDVSLVRGAVYVQTSESRSPVEITIHTRDGRVTHIGTRFEVRVDRETTLVRVRDGSALFSRPSQPSVRIDAGQQLLISGDSITRGAAPPAFGPAWDWASRVAPSIEIDGRALFDVLEALCHESGMQVRYATVEVREQARRTTLHGNIDGLDVRSALRVVLAGTDLAYELHPDRIEILAASPR